MTRTLFLAGMMMLASLGAGAQNSSQQNPPNQQNQIQQVDHSNATQPTTASQPSPSGAQATATGAQTPAVGNGELPQTSTILPLLGLIGLGSLVAGFFSRR